ncbi:MAG: transglycosylase SLT domain-containing protein [Candidatus Nanoarchaeia archaeon]|nr:transglycosylase SLT domain-containing protein [Candidatus Nanoarchaeia archaeon]
MKKIIAITLIVIFLLSNVSFAATTRTQPSSRSSQTISRYASTDTIRSGLSYYDNLGEAINVYPTDYEPNVLSSNLLTKGNVPVFVYLSGNTLGSFLGEQISTGEPTIGVPTINNIIITPLSYNPYIKSIDYYPPTSFYLDQLSPIKSALGTMEYNDLDNLGIVIIELNKFSSEDQIPENIDLNLSARIEFSTARTLNYGQLTKLIYQKSKDEFAGDASRESRTVTEGLRNIWTSLTEKLSRRTDQGATSFAEGIDSTYQDSFLDGAYYVRLDNIEDDSATIQVYDNTLTSVGGLQTLKVGETTSAMSLGGLSSLFSSSATDTIRVRLDSILNSLGKSAIFEIYKEDQINIIEAFENNYISGTDWFVEEIKDEDESGEVKLTNKKEEKTINLIINKNEQTYSNVNPCSGSKSNPDPESDLTFDLDCEAIANFNRAREYVISNADDWDRYTEQIILAYRDLIKKATNANELDDVNSFKSRILDELGNIKNPALLPMYGEYLKDAIGTTVSSSENIDIDGEEAIIELKTIKKQVGASAKVSVDNQVDSYGISAKLKGTDYKVVEINDKNIIITTGDYIKNPTALTESDIAISATQIGGRTIKNDYDSLILKYSKEYDVDPLLVKALIAIESGFDTKAISKTNEGYCGAVGLMQLMPGAANEAGIKDENIYKELEGQKSTCAYKIDNKKYLEQLAELSKSEKTKEQDIRFDAEENIKAGVKFLKLKYEKTKDATSYNSMVDRLKDNTYCTSYIETWKNYKGWERALRLYNGMSCDGEKQAADETYVEKIIELRNQLENALLGNSNYNKNSEQLKNGYHFPSAKADDSKTLKINEEEKIKDSSGKEIEVELKEVKAIKAAQISIIPGRANVYSTSEFNVNIPIDKGIKLFNLTTEELDTHIDNLDSVIDSLNGIINKTEDIVKGWTIGCGATFMFITAKNFLLGNKADARSVVMNGYDNVMGIKEFCQTNSIMNINLESVSKVGKYYESYDKCLTETGAFAENIIDEVDEKIEDFNDALKDGNIYSTQAYSDLAKEAKIDENGKELTVDSDEVKEYLFLNSILNNKPDGTSGKEKAYFETIKKQKDTLIKSVQKKNEIYSEVKSLFGEDIKSDENKKKIFDTVYSSLESQSSETFKKRQSEWKANTDKKPVGCEEITGSISEVVIENGKGVGFVVDNEGKTVQTINDLNRVDVSGNLNKIVGASSLYTSSNGCYLVLKETDNKGERKDYDKNAAAEFYSDGKPYCVPYEKGVYLKVTKQLADGSAGEISSYNVGPDGKLCTGDDISLESSSFLKEKEPSKLLKYQTYVNSLKTCTQGQRIKSKDGKWFNCETNAANKELNKAIGHCTDSMSVSDCKMLFNVCDPIVCPVSRFNAGGNWYVKDVVRSGIIGSIVLPQGSGDILPVCATGILAGLKNIRSIFQSGKDCLTTQKEDGKSVGLCDKIQSIYICDVFWREAEGATQFISNFFNGNMISSSSTDGGGEYLDFSSSYETALKSVEFFTSEYGTIVDQSYKSTKLTQIKMELCKGVVTGSIPNLGEFITKLVNPRDPPQYIATLSSKTYSEKFGANEYNVFFHIYAGTTQEANAPTQLSYRVYLRDSSTGRRHYVTFGDEGSTSESKGQIEYGGYVTKNVDTVAGEGFEEVCIEINEVTECGFGRVTTDYALNKLQDDAVAEEATKEITNEEECVPEEKSKIEESLDTITGVGSSTDSIRRICSVNDPDGNSENDYWRRAGSCGKDSNGIALGDCWLDTRSFSLDSLSNYENVSSYLEEKKVENLRNKGITALTDEEKETKLSEIKNTKSVKELQALLDSVQNSELRAEIYYQTGFIYLEAGKGKEDYRSEGDHGDVFEKKSEVAAEKTEEAKEDGCSGLKEGGLKCSDDKKSIIKCESNELKTSQECVFGCENTKCNEKLIKKYSSNGKELTIDLNTDVESAEATANMFKVDVEIKNNNQLVINLDRFETGGWYTFSIKVKIDGKEYSEKLSIKL